MTAVAQPAGEVTLVFSDIESSTRLLEDLGTEAYREALAEHRRIVREAYGRYSGYEVDYEGDAFFYTFASAQDAVAAVSEAIAKLAAGPIRIRVGIHTGTPGLDPPKYVGMDVHLAARIMSSAHGGQVVLSRATADLVDGVEMTDLGEHRLKDIAEPVAIFQFGDGSFPPLKTISNTNLPRPASSFVGRERELAEVLGRIEGGARLLTLTGPGGSGKTRLALEAATTLVPEYKAGVFWVGLASLRDPALVADTIAQTLGAKDGLAEHIGDREMLLLLDNLEQVIEVAPELSSLVSLCPNLSLLLTSRELLRVQGEVEFAVPPLAEPEAVELFCERAQLEPSDEIAELCARLDNLPLAVELAAARTKALTPAQILERLSQRLDLLKGGRDAVPRQQTLRATIEWSYDLLLPEEQRLFARLSVFAGGCTLEAAEEVADADLDTLQSLVERSLLRFSSERYSMLETIREYALDRIKESSEADVFGRAHAEYHLRVAQAVDAEIRGPKQEALLEQLDRELANMRVALAWLLEHVPEQALSLTLLLDPLWTVRGHLREGGRWFDAGLAAAQAADVTLRASALREAGDTARMLGDEPRALMLYEESLRLETELDRKPGIADALLSLGREQESLAIFEEIGDEIGVASALHHLGGKALEAGDYTQAREAFEQAVSIRRRLASTWALAPSLHSLGDCALLEGRVREANARYQESLRLALELQSPRLIAYCLAGLASVAAIDRRPEAAGLLWAAAETIEQERGFQLLGTERERYERLLPEADPKFAEAHVQGRTLSFEQAIVYAKQAVAEPAWRLPSA